MQASMGRDQKVWDETLSGSTRLAVSLPGLTRQAGALLVQRIKGYAECCQGFVELLLRWKMSPHFRPDDFASQEANLPSAHAAKRPARSRRSARSARKHRAERSNQRRFARGESSFGFQAGPRVRAISLSTSMGGRIPVTLSTGSAAFASLRARRTPSRVSNSRTCPARRPSFSRRGFGIVTCPFSETIAFIPGK